MSFQYRLAAWDISTGLGKWRVWGHLGWSEAKRRYRRTVIGPFWTTLNLGILIASLSAVWTALWGIPVGSYVSSLAAGMIAWTFISAVINEAGSTFLNQQNLLTQFKMPYTMFACATVWRNLVVFVHNLALFLIIILLFSVSIGWQTLMFIPGVAVIVVNGLWFTLLFGLVCTRFRDLQQLVGNSLQIIMLITPILWPVEQMPARGVAVITWNPFYHFIEIIRAPLLGKMPTGLNYVVVAGITIVGWTMTYAVFSRFRRRLTYWL